MLLPSLSLPPVFHEFSSFVSGGRQGMDKRHIPNLVTAPALRQWVRQHRECRSEPSGEGSYLQPFKCEKRPKREIR
jgi:hypothetical protein